MEENKNTDGFLFFEDIQEQRITKGSKDFEKALSSDIEHLKRNLRTIADIIRKLPGITGRKIDVVRTFRPDALVLDFQRVGEKETEPDERTREIFEERLVERGFDTPFRNQGSKTYIRYTQLFKKNKNQ